MKHNEGLRGEGGGVKEGDRLNCIMYIFVKCGDDSNQKSGRSVLSY